MEKSALKHFSQKTVLITGGTGSFGQAFAKKLLADADCHKVIIFSRDELKQWEMRQSDPLFNHPNIRYFLGDVRDSTRLHRAFQDVDIIIHAAALKQVPAAEYNPSEFVKTNVMGAMNVVDQAINAGVKQVIALSTDKAVNPVNLYGATKLCSDRLFIAGNSYVGKRGYPTFSVVRYGNVLATRGSVLPLWRKLLASGEKSLPITDKRMTRFWITLPQAVDFVIDSCNRARGGEIFVPKIPSMRIEDLAEAIAPGLQHIYTGVRAGEKLHEMMFGTDDSRHTREYDDHYMIVPEIYSETPEHLEKFLLNRPGKPVPDGFAYTSDGNKNWITVDQLRKLL